MGYLLLGIAVILGLYFLFELLVPILGFIESGVLFTLFFAILGLLLIFVSRRKQSRPVDDAMEKASEAIKSLELDIQKNGYKIIIFSFVTGLVLSQLKGCSKGNLKRLGSFLKKISYFK
ncbi:MAG TPA: hypothetical protein VMW10_09675 [Alphaproteobacteria bacterium]|nr:hypothetical protein [Alphaproteobacteria bacterium]